MGEYDVVWEESSSSWLTTHRNNRWYFGSYKPPLVAKDVNFSEATRLAQEANQRIK